MTLDEIKAFGAPFRRAKVQVSRKKKLLLLMFLVTKQGEEINPSILIGWPGDEYDDVQLRDYAIEEAKNFGLLADDGLCSLQDLDRLTN